MNQKTVIAMGAGAIIGLALSKLPLVPGIIVSGVAIIYVNSLK